MICDNWPACLVWTVFRPSENSYLVKVDESSNTGYKGDGIRCPYSRRCRVPDWYAPGNRAVAVAGAVVAEGGSPRAGDARGPCCGDLADRQRRGVCRWRAQGGTSWPDLLPVRRNR